MSQINKYIFREYDIRGIVSEDFPDHVVKYLGQAFGTFVIRAGGKEVAISGDIRLTTPTLINQFKIGLLSTGVDVINLGILPTPVNYFSMFELGVHASVQITGSHNPPEFNGFKLSMDKKPVYGKDIQSIRRLIKEKDFENGEGTEARYKLLDTYNAMILEKINIEKPIRLVMDCGNAAAALNAPKLFKSLGIQLKELFCEPDGTFPNHHPDPTVEKNLSALIAEVKSGDYDLGIAFDGDADRVGVVDEKGDIIKADQLMSIFLPEIIKKGDDIIFDVKCSEALIDMIKRYGGNPIMWKTGHSLIKQKMSELQCKFGGEMSGHIFFADDYYGYDDALYVAARLVQLLSRTKKTLSELKSEIPTYYSSPEIRLQVKNDEEKFLIIDKAVKYFKENFDCIAIDGVRINFENGWGLVRSSNTQPVIVCRFEATSEKEKSIIENLVFRKLKSFGDFEIGEL